MDSLRPHQRKQTRTEAKQYMVINTCSIKLERVVQTDSDVSDAVDSSLEDLLTHQSWPVGVSGCEAAAEGAAAVSVTPIQDVNQNTVERSPNRSTL